MNPSSPVIHWRCCAFDELSVHELQRIQGRYALCTMCIGVGQGIAVILEKV